MLSPALIGVADLEAARLVLAHANAERIAAAIYLAELVTEGIALTEADLRKYRERKEFADGAWKSLQALEAERAEVR